MSPRGQYEGAEGGNLNRPGLIINADGFGLSSGINRAVSLVAGAGAISSVSVSPNFPAVRELPLFHKRYPHISIGVHLNPAVGAPVSEPGSVPTLVDREGFFWRRSFSRRLAAGLIRERDLLSELHSQIDLIRTMGVPVSHLDSHQNLHLLPRFFPVFLRLAEENGISRMRCHNHFVCMAPKDRRARIWRFYATRPLTAGVHLYTRFLMLLAKKKGMRMADRLVHSARQGGKSELVFWRNLFSGLPPGTSEVYCHPAFVDGTLERWASYVRPREAEMRLLLSNEFSSLLQNSGARLMSFNDL